ncbi:RHS repeat protein [Verrucosispora sp. WMMA2121]|nr:RHS repeat-associated core domain-containing protein [Verrucosispora sp. WMMA2121]MCZ7420756.1 RHS repeat protein [Verrucosispora sp. WMMA2121]
MAAPAVKPGVQPVPVVPVKPVTPVRFAANADLKSASAKRTPAWPAPASTTLDVPADGSRKSAKAGQLPVRVARPGRDRSVAAPNQVRLKVFDRTATARAGVRGVLLRLDPVGPKAGEVEVSVDYREFATAYGGDWASRLRLVALPDCALATPAAPECAGRPLRSANDLRSGTVSATVPLALDGAMVALAAGDSGPTGSYKATSLSPSSTWTAGGNSGSFNWGYPMRVPPALGGPAPSVTLNYSSQSVDGRHAASNNQPSWAGEGFELSPGGYIERSYKPCAEDREGSANNDEETGDQCWETDNATLSLNGSSGELIYNSTEGRWHLRSDDGSRIERKTGASNGDNNGEYWVVTTTDGTQYWFGVNRLPGWASGDPVTNSAWNVPVFGNEPGEPCHATAFADSDCTQTWRWNLDYVVDLHGNSVSYWYTKEVNRYLRNIDKTDKAAYDRGGWLDHISYGTRRVGGTDSVLDTAAPFRVNFATSDRCLSNCATHNEVRWPDTPWDQECTSSQTDCDNYSPTFWSTKRLASVTTQVRDGSGYDNVERWTLHHSFPDPGDGTRAGLWLDKISHTGLVGGSASVPDIEFTPVQLSNRVDTIDFAAAMNWMRVARIRNESGGTVNITYSGQDCQAGQTPTPHTNTRRCYPVIWKPEGYENSVTDWFHKYVVKTIYETDHTGGVPPQGSPRVVYNYDYLDGAAWHYSDDDGLIEKENKTWSDFRGYGRVAVTVGDPGEQTYTETRYFRGMHGDKAAPTGGTRTVNVDGIADEDWYSGMTRETKSFNGPGGPVVSRQTNDPWASAPTATRTVNGDTVTARFNRVATVRNYTTLDAGRGERMTRSTTTYDSYGMAVSVDDLGQDGVSGDERCTKTDYTPRATSVWLMDRVHRTQSYAVKCADTAGTLSEDDVIGETRTSYDGNAFETVPTRGLKTRTETMSDFNGGSPLFVTTEQVEYDVHGRVTKSTNAANAATRTAYTPASDGPVTAITITNALNHVTTNTVEPGWGSNVAVVDPNNKRTDLAYDPFGRLTEVWLPGRSKSTQTASVKFSYHVRTDAATAISTSRLNAAGTYNTTWSLLDGLLRVRQTQAGSPSGGRLLTDTFYDSAGRKVRAFDSYHTTGSPGSTLVTATERALVPDQDRTVYDGAGRVVAEIFQPYDVERWRTKTYHAGDRTDITPPAGGTATSVRVDGRGQTVELRHYHGATPTPGTPGSWDSTTYQHDRKGQLTRVTDAMGNTWKYTYDIRGRQIEVDDPDKGLTVSTYDNAGRLSTHTDAEGRKLAYLYDPLDRKRAVYDNQVGGTMRAQWVYDTLAKGQLTQSTRFVGSASYQVRATGYTDSYQRTGTQVVIPTSETGLAGTYNFLYGYHPDDSLASSSLPGTADLPLETLTYGYDAFGSPLTLDTLYGGQSLSYVADSQYNALRQLDQYELYTGSGGRVWQKFTRELETGRLTGVRIDRDSQAPHTLSDRRYTYDPAGNVTRAQDVAPDPVADTQCFSYDYMQRLVEAWTPSSGNCGASRSVAALGGPAPYWHSWRFDRAGNRSLQTVHTAAGDSTTNYNYPAAGSPRPHAVTATSGAQNGSYSYDATGNMTSRSGGSAGTQTLTWSPEGQLESSTDLTGTTEYIYDADGNRLIRRDPAGRTLYLPQQEIRYDNTSGTTSCTRYYSFAGNVVASRTAAGLTWLGADHQGTAQVAVNAVTQDATIRRHTPYGAPRGGDPTWVNDKGFVGGTRDNTGLIHLGARMYDQGLGIFISVDPLIDMMDVRSLNAYAYAWGSPLTFSDPDGQWPKWVKSVTNTVTSAAKASAKYVYDNAGTISAVTGVLAIVCAPVPGLGAGLAAVSAITGAIDTYKNCTGGNKLDCGIGVASMIPGAGALASGARAAQKAKKAASAAKEARATAKALDGATGSMKDFIVRDIKATQDLDSVNRYVDRLREVDSLVDGAYRDARAAEAHVRRLAAEAERRRKQWNYAGNVFTWENASWSSTACFQLGDCSSSRHDYVFGGQQPRGGGNGGNGGSRPPAAPSAPSAPSAPAPGGGCQNIKVPGGWLLC